MSPIFRCFFFVFVVSGSFVLTATVDAKPPSYVVVNVPVANIRVKPGLSHPVLWQTEKYMPLKVMGKSGDWYKIRDFEGDIGWISGRIIRKDVRAVVVWSKKCRVRSGPGLEAAVFFTVERGVPLRVIEKKGDWILIQHADGDRGWISRSCVHSFK